MVSDTKPRNGTVTTFLVRVWKGLGNFKAQNETLNRLIVQNEALQKRLDLARGDAAHWKGKYEAAVADLDRNIAAALSGRKALRDVRSAASRKGWQTRRAA